MSYGFNTDLVFNKESKKIFIDALNHVNLFYYFDELSIKSKYRVIKELIVDSKLFLFEDGSDTLVGAYSSLKNCGSNLFTKDGIVVSNGGLYA